MGTTGVRPLGYSRLLAAVYGCGVPIARTAVTYGDEDDGEEGTGGESTPWLLEACHHGDGPLDDALWSDESSRSSAGASHSRSAVGCEAVAHWVPSSGGTSTKK